jgi:hypothetical protein
VRAPLAIVCLVSIAGFYSTLVHPTRVNNEFRLGAALSLSVVSDSSSSVESGPAQAKTAALPSLDLEASLGIRDTSVGDPGFGLRLSGRAGLGGYGGSAYAELPRAWAGDIDAGVGVQLHRGALTMFTPYVQVGAMRGKESAWFLRSGAASVSSNDSTDWKLLWIPTVGWYRHRRSGFDGGLYLSAVIGDQPTVKRDCILFGCLAGEGSGNVRTFLVFGMTVSAPLAAERLQR